MDILLVQIREIHGSAGEVAKDWTRSSNVRMKDAEKAIQERNICKFQPYAPHGQHPSRLTIIPQLSPSAEPQSKASLQL